MLRVIVCFICLGISASVSLPAFSAVILQYHHVSTQTPAVTSVSPAQFRQHMQMLRDEHFRVVTLTDLIRQRSSTEKLVAITFDDGYRNILENAAPILAEFAYPYTVFINPDQIGNRSDQLSWAEVKTMATNGAQFANHTNGHIHLLQHEQGEDETQWLARVRRNILDAENQLQQQLGYSLKMLAYPYGEYDPAIESLLSELGFLGFAQHSGAVGERTALTAISRYPAAGVYANPATLKVKLNSLPMPVIASSLHSTVFSSAKYPVFNFSLEPEDVQRNALQCYLGTNKVPVKFEGATVEVDASATAMPAGRSRINCTAPSLSQRGRYYWYSQPFFKADAKGHWPE